MFKYCCSHLTHLLYHLQHGFLKGKSTVNQLLEVYHEIVESIASGAQVDAVHMDLSKAFDKVTHPILLAKLSKHGIVGKLLGWFRDYLTNRQQRVVIDGVYSDWLPVTSGVPQGSILGPLLFLVYINDMPNYIVGDSKLALFADDSKLYNVIKSDSDQNVLQNDINCVHKWSVDSNMIFNTNKCKVLHMSKRRSKVVKQYKIGNDDLPIASETKDLGIIVTSSLSWNTHIQEISCKANRSLGLIRRICGREIQDLQTRKALYTTIVRPQLEYASSVWSPMSKKCKRTIENVQRRATKFILNYPEDMNYNERLFILNLQPLEHRRQITDLVLLFKLKHNFIQSGLTNHIKELTKPNRASRNFNKDNIKELNTFSQDYYLQSFLPRTIRLWNALPAPFKVNDLTLPKFKNLLTSHYNSQLEHYLAP